MFDAIQNELQYRFGTQGANEGTVKEGADGQYKIGWAGRLVGVTPEMMRASGNDYDRRAFASKPLGQKAASYGLLPKSGPVNEFEIGKNVRNAEAVESLQQQALQLNVPNALDMSDVGVLGNAIRTQKEANANESYLKNPVNIEETRRYDNTQKKALEAFKLAREDIEYNREEASARRAFERGENLMNKRHERELAMLSGDRQMAIAEMQEGLQDRRMDFDRETMRMDKRDRMIAQLMSGLGALSGAFG